MAKHFADSNEILESQPKHLSDEETLSHTDETAPSHQETHQELGADSDEKVSGSESNAASDTDASHIEDAKSATTAIQRVDFLQVVSFYFFRFSQLHSIGILCLKTLLGYVPAERFLRIQGLFLQSIKISSS